MRRKKRPFLQLSSRCLHRFFALLVSAAFCFRVWTFIHFHPASGRISEAPDIFVAQTNVASAVKKPLHVREDCSSVSSFQDVLRCFKKGGFDFRTNDMSCRLSISTWSDVQRCLNVPGRSGRSSRITDISLIGERSSGTKFIIDEIKKCFPRKEFGVRIHRDYIRPKHWFQPTTTPRLARTRIVIASFRDPVEWIASMIENPYHSPNHINGFDENMMNPIPLDWEEFVRRSWSMPNRTQNDLQAYYSKKGAAALDCQYHFQFQEAMPCMLDNTTLLHGALHRAYFPLYELRRNSSRGSMGIPFDNIMQLRSDKIVNFLLEVPLTQRLGGYLAVRYEDLLLNGTRSMMEQVASMLGLSELPAKCKPQGAEPWRLGKRKIADGLRQWVKENLNVETERLLGYPFPFQ